MANLRTAIDSGFWDQNISSPQTLDSIARQVPGEPFPLDASRASRALRIQQLSLLGTGFPLGIIPSFSPASTKELGSFSLQSLLLRPYTSNWWLGLVGQFRPRKLLSDIKAQVRSAQVWNLSLLRNAGKHVVDKSLYSLGLSSQLSLGSSTALFATAEAHGDKKGHRNKFMLFHKLPNHDITLEAAFPELFIDHKGRYWDVPESISLDMASLVTESGLRYRLGIHKNSGTPQAVNGLHDDTPTTLMPGICAKAAFSFEKSRDIWRQKKLETESLELTDDGSYVDPSYDIRFKEPHAAISGIIGGNCAAWLGGQGQLVSKAMQRDIIIAKKRSPLNADLFGSICYTFQHGSFRELYGDLTRVDARLDICSASALTKRIFNTLRSSTHDSINNPLSSPRLNLILQQQVAGPFVFRIDSQFRVDSGKHGPRMEDLIYTLSCSFKPLRSGKVVAWYSPKRKEGMVELRLFEF